MQLEKRQRSQKLFEPHDCPASKKEKIIAQRYFPKTCNLRFEKDFFGKEIRLGAALGKKVEFFESDWLESDHKISFASKENEGNPAPNDLQRLCFSYRLCFGFNRLLLKRLFRF